MTAKSITYWITTPFLAGDKALAGVLYLTHVPLLMNAFAHLGYPAYFPNILGVAKILGAVALLVPGVQWRRRCLFLQRPSLSLESR